MDDFITYHELRETFKRCALRAGFTEEWFDEISKTHGLPFLVRYIAADLWLRQVPEDEDTIMLRKQAFELNEHGCFNVKKQ